MNAREAIKNDIGAMSDAQLRATFDAIDAKITTARECPAEFAVRLALCDELDRRHISYAPEYDAL